jgi:hypothetical protein
VTPILNALSVDVEDYFQVSAFSDAVAYEAWDRFECRVERNTRQLLDLFDQSPSDSRPSPSCPRSFCLFDDSIGRGSPVF